MCQPKFLPETLEPHGAEHALESSKKRKAPSASTNRTRMLSLEELQGNFHLPINEVACKLGVCVTVLKQQCRELGIVRWPYRKVRKLDNMLTALESSGPSKARPFALINGEDERQQKICSVKQTLQELIHHPNSCAHLKLGKVKHAHPLSPASTPSACTASASPPQGKGILERLGVLPKLEGVSVEEGDSGDQAVQEAAQALVCGAHESPESQSMTGSRDGGALQQADLLALMDASVPPRYGEGDGDMEEDDGSYLKFSLSREFCPPPKKDLQACWMRPVKGDCSNSGLLAAHLGEYSQSSTPLGEDATGLQFAPGSTSPAVGGQASLSGSSSMDGNGSVRGGRARSGTVELDLISRLDSPRSLSNYAVTAAGEQEADPGQTACGVSADLSGGNTLVEQRAENQAMANVPLGSAAASPFASIPRRLPLSVSPPAMGIPVLYSCPFPCLAPAAPGTHLVPANVLQYQNQQLAMHHQKLLGYPSPHQISPALLNSAVEAMNVQRHAFMAGQLAQFNATGYVVAQGPTVTGSFMPPKGASC